MAQKKKVKKIISEGTIEYEYTESDNYMLHPVTGAWGGANPKGEVVVRFFTEEPCPPQKALMQFKDHKILNEEQIKDTKDNVFLREFQTGIILRPDIAHTIGKWLMDKAITAGLVVKDNKPGK